MIDTTSPRSGGSTLTAASPKGGVVIDASPRNPLKGWVVWLGRRKVAQLKSGRKIWSGRPLV